jgi:RNA polymerase sigma factor (sigma-70 family)
METKVRQKCDETFRLEVAALFEKYSPLMVEGARTVLGDRSVARDVVQDVFVKIMEANRPLPQLMKNPKGFLYKMSVNQALDMVKAPSRRRLIDVDVGSLEIAVPSPDSHLHGRIELLRAAMAQMKPEYVETLNLFYVEGFDCEEIAQMRCKFVLTVWKDLSRARAELKRLMKENDSETQKKDKHPTVHRPGLAKTSKTRG